MANLIEYNKGSLANELAGTGESFCSMKAETMEEKKKLYKAMTAADKKVGDCINQKISIKDVFMDIFDIANEETGEVESVPHIVLIDSEGTSYEAVSKGVFDSLKNLVQIFGSPTWEDPIDVIVKQRTIKNGHKMLTLDLV